MALHNTIYRARWVLPIDRPPIENGFVSVSNGLIEDVAVWNPTKLSSRASVVDLGDVALIPALVNAHTHLEFSHLREPLGFPGIEFTDWIRLVVRQRNRDQNIHLPLPATTSVSERNDSEDALRIQTTPSKANSIRRGLAESYRGGVSCLGEIATFPCQLDDYRCTIKDGMQGVIFYEQLGRNANLFPLRSAELDHFLAAQPTGESALQLGVSPHAPYSVHPLLLDQMIASAICSGSTVAMHLAETESELELLTRQTGPFVELLQEFGIWDPASFKAGLSIEEILARLSRCLRVLIVHGNYLTREEHQILARHRNHMTLVFCPRTHHFFQHADYPLEALLDAGVRVAVGTDSRASNPDLNLFAELQQIHSQFSKIAPLKILQMGTLDGASGLGQAQQLGSLSPQKLARLSVIESESQSTADWEWLFDSSARCHPIKSN